MYSCERLNINMGHLFAGVRGNGNATAQKSPDARLFRAPARIVSDYTFDPSVPLREIGAKNVTVALYPLSARTPAAYGALLPVHTRRQF